MESRKPCAAVRSGFLASMTAIAGFSASSVIGSKAIASGVASSIAGTVASKAVVGVKLPALNASTMTERLFMEKAGKIMMMTAHGWIAIGDRANGVLDRHDCWKIYYCLLLFTTMKLMYVRVVNKQGLTKCLEMSRLFGI